LVVATVIARQPLQTVIEHTKVEEELQRNPKEMPATNIMADNKFR